MTLATFAFFVSGASQKVTRYPHETTNIASRRGEGMSCFLKEFDQQ
jgi:hypothetical protein